MVVRPFRVRRGLALALPFATLAAPALAGDDDRAATPEGAGQVRAALEAKSYTDVHDVEVDGGRFEVDATNASKQRVDLELDLTTLAILEEDPD
jgi:hypothetical protein